MIRFALVGASLVAVLLGASPVRASVTEVSAAGLWRTTEPGIPERPPLARVSLVAVSPYSPPEPGPCPFHGCPVYGVVSYQSSSRDNWTALVTCMQVRGREAFLGLRDSRGRSHAMFVRDAFPPGWERRSQVLRYEPDTMNLLFDREFNCFEPRTRRVLRSRASVLFGDAQVLPCRRPFVYCVWGD